MGRLDKMLLWGHTLADYRQMFALSDADLDGNILDYGAGPASFCAELTQQGGRVVACDEIYQLDAQQIRDTFEKEFDQMMETVTSHAELFVWKSIASPDVLRSERERSFELFLADYEKGKVEKRYLTEDVPHMRFQDNQFQVAISSHALFITHSDKPPEFHVDAIAELCRVAHEVRIFPLLDDRGQISPLVGPVLLGLQQLNLHSEVREVDYEFQKGGNAMMRVWMDACPV